MKKENKQWKGMNNQAGASAVYGLGLIGAIIYYFQQATTLGEGIIGLVKAILWPAFLIYELFKFLNL